MELTGASIVEVPSVLDGDGVRTFLAALRGAIAAPAGAIVLRGAERGVFCRGMDFAAASDGNGSSDAIDAFAACLSAIRFASRPVLSFVDGEALGGGVGIAAASDAVLATPDATFGLPELVFGLAPAILLPYLAERITPQRLRWLALLSERLDAPSALRIGLVDRVEAPDACPRALRSWIARLTRVRADAIERWKQMTIVMPTAGSMDGPRITREALADPRVRERLRRFADGGDPPWAAEDP